MIELERLYEILDKEVNPRNLLSINIQSWLLLESIRYNLNKARNNIPRRGRRLREPDYKKSIIEELCLEAYRCDNPELRELLDRANKMLTEIKNALAELGFQTIDLYAETKSRLIVGTSHEELTYLITDVGLAWDTLLNLPYIPASSLKGAFRAYLTLNNIVVEEHRVSDLLGSNIHQSLIVFVDSYPVACRDYLLIPEVTTPIYPEHKGKIMETKVQPVPVVYPVVNTGVRFRLIVGVRQEATKKSSRLVDALLRYLSETLREGVGSKTTLGYGTITTQ